MRLSYKLLSNFHNDYSNSLDRTNKGVSACELDKNASWQIQDTTFFYQDF